MTSEENYCLQLLRQRSYPVYLSILYAPEKKRGALAAVYAFQTEVLHISKTVKEPLLAEIRLQWWKDSLKHSVNTSLQGTAATQQLSSLNKKTEDNSNGNKLSPILTSLANAITAHNLQLSSFLKIIEAVKLDLQIKQIPSMQALEHFFSSTYGVTLQLACKILYNNHELNIDGICQSAAKAQGIMNVLRSLVADVKQDKFYIPTMLLQTIGLDNKDKFKAIILDNTPLSKKGDDRDYQRINALLLAVFDEAYNQFKTEQKHINNYIKPAFLSLAILPCLAKMASLSLPQDSKFKLPLIIQHFRIMQAALFNRY